MGGAESQRQDREDRLTHRFGLFMRFVDNNKNIEYPALSFNAKFCLLTLFETISRCIRWNEKKEVSDLLNYRLHHFVVKSVDTRHLKQKTHHIKHQTP